ncbi:MAG: SDR family NAD(P)-dependent oxidoreductase, partial [Halioglobus sp.]
SKGKTAVITGAGSGIGRALAQQLNREGCKLLLSDIDPRGLEDTLQSLERSDLAAESLILDVSDKNAVHAWAEDIAARHHCVDIVINNAGVGLMASVEESEYADIEWLMGINFWGVVYGTKAFLPLLRNSTQGHLVNVSSIFGIVGIPTQSAYNAAKFAVRGYTEALRHELADSNVHVCCVHPGGIKTNIARNGRTMDSAMTADQRGANFEKIARTTAQSAANEIILAIEKHKIRLLIGNDARLLSLLSRLFPVNYSRFIPGLRQSVSSLSS